MVPGLAQAHQATPYSSWFRQLPVQEGAGSWGVASGPSRAGDTLLPHGALDFGSPCHHGREREGDAGR